MLLGSDASFRFLGKYSLCWASFTIPVVFLDQVRSSEVYTLKNSLHCRASDAEAGTLRNQPLQVANHLLLFVYTAHYNRVVVSAPAFYLFDVLLVH